MHSGHGHSPLSSIGPSDGNELLVRFHLIHWMDAEHIAIRLFLADFIRSDARLVYVRCPHREQWTVRSGPPEKPDRRTRSVRWCKRLFLYQVVTFCAIFLTLALVPKIFPRKNIRAAIAVLCFLWHWF